MLPLLLFRSRAFSVTNLTTLAVYGALSGALFLVVYELQRVAHYSALQSGASLIPITFLLLVLSSRAGALSSRIGPRLPMTIGPVMAGVGLLLMSRIANGGSYVTTVLPAAIVFGLGLSLTVAPLTATVLAAVDDARAGIASGVNNAVARIAGLVAVAVLPFAAGIDTSGDPHGANLSAGFQRAMWISAAICIAGGLVSLVGIPDKQRLRGSNRQ